MSTKDAFIEAVYPAFMAQGYFEPTARAMAELAFKAYEQMKSPQQDHTPHWTDLHNLGDAVYIRGIITEKDNGKLGVTFGYGVDATLYNADVIDLLPAPSAQTTGKFMVGDHVHKTTGYLYEGDVVAKFLARDNNVRYVVENDFSQGLLHIFNEQQLEKSS